MSALEMSGLGWVRLVLKSGFKSGRCEPNVKRVRGTVVKDAFSDSDHRPALADGRGTSPFVRCQGEPAVDELGHGGKVPISEVLGLHIVWTLDGAPWAMILNNDCAVTASRSGARVSTANWCRSELLRSDISLTPYLNAG